MISKVWTFFNTPASAPVEQGPVPTPLAWQAQIDTLAGDGVGGLRDGAGAQARFADPYALAVDAHGVAYIADAGDNNRIRRVYPDGRVDTLAGTGEGWRDGPGVQAQFHTPSGIALDAAGTDPLAQHSLTEVTNLEFSLGAIDSAEDTGLPPLK